MLKVNPLLIIKPNNNAVDTIETRYAINALCHITFAITFMVAILVAGPAIKKINAAPGLIP